MPTVLPSQIQNLIADTGYPVMLEEYAAHPRYFEQYTTVAPSSAAWMPNIGHKKVLHGGVEQLVEIEPGQEIHASSVGGTRTALGKIRKLARMISFPVEVWNSSNADAVMGRDIRALSQRWAQYSSLKKDEIVAGLFNNGALTAGSTADFKNQFADERSVVDGFIYDGLPFFDTAHLSLAGTSYSNHTASRNLTQANFETTYTTMTATNNRDERDQRVPIMPNILMVPADLRSTALELIQSEMKLGAGANADDINAINANRGIVQVVVNPFLTDTDGWFLGSARGVEVFDSGAPEFRTAFNEREQSIEVYVSTYIGAMVVNWREWYACNVAAS